MKFTLKESLNECLIIKKLLYRIINVVHRLESSEPEPRLA